MEGIDREVRVGGAMHSETPSPLSRGCALCPPAPPPVLPRTAKQGCYRSYGTCTGRIPAVWPGCRMTWLVRASPASATATPVTAGQAVRVQDSGSKRPIQRAEGWTRSAAVRRSRVSPPRGYTTVRVSAPARASRITSACMASSSLRERERRWCTTPQRKLPYLSKIRGGSPRKMARAFSFTL